jgi:hypothetical protein
MIPTIPESRLDEWEREARAWLDAGAELDRDPMQAIDDMARRIVTLVPFVRAAPPPPTTRPPTTREAFDLIVAFESAVDAFWQPEHDGSDEKCAAARDALLDYVDALARRAEEAERLARQVHCNEPLHFDSSVLHRAEKAEAALAASESRAAAALARVGALEEPAVVAVHALRILANHDGSEPLNGSLFHGVPWLTAVTRACDGLEDALAPASTTSTQHANKEDADE